MSAQTNLKPLKRVFQWNGLEIPDPNARLKPEEVLKVLGTIHPELNNASLEGPTFQADKEVYTCCTRLGTKG
jgi:PRTRC genetic system protein C